MFLLLTRPKSSRFKRISLSLITNVGIGFSAHHESCQSVDNQWIESNLTTTDEDLDIF